MKLVDLNQLHKQLPVLREKKGLNKSQTAARLGISSQLYGQYEQGKKKPKPDFFIKWKEIFGEDLMKQIETKVSIEGVHLDGESESPGGAGLLKEFSEALKRENALLREKIANYASIEAVLKEQDVQLGLIREELAELKALISPAVIPPLKYSSGRKNDSSSPTAART